MDRERNPNSPIHRKLKQIKFTQTPFVRIDSNQGLIDHLPQDMLVEILKWLPVKSLLNFRCVSKSWCSLISNPEFIKTHLQHSSKNRSYSYHRVVLTSVRKPFDLEICSLNSLLCNPVIDTTVSWPRECFDVVDSCNGLVCITCRVFGDLLLWNPSTRKHRKLPHSGSESPDRWPESKSHQRYYGFGFDESTNDYKIIKKADSKLPTVEVYSLKTDSWKRLKDFPGFPTSKYAKFVNGRFHWAAEQSHGKQPDIVSLDIVSLDIETETYGKIEMPFSVDSVRDNLGVLGGCLSMLISDYPNCSGGDLWILKEYGVKQSWAKVVHIPYIYPNNSLKSSPLYMLNNGQIFLLCGSIFVLYNLKDESMMNPVANNSSQCCAANIYVESLVSPNADGGLGTQYE